MAIALKQLEAYRVAFGDGVELRKSSPHATEFCEDKKRSRQELKKLREQINELAQILAIENRRSLLIVLQGMDASGKDGTIKRVFTGVNPQFCRVVSFKEPDREERDHDYLWRVYRALPAKGELVVFNRSHYEDVIALKARGVISTREAHMRLRQIGDVERAWSENGIVIRKLFLHISREEQTSRFKARLDNPRKHWKLQESDFADRTMWPKFQSAYEEALTRTSTLNSPWYIIPADHKWYRDLAVAAIVLYTLKEMRPRIPKPHLDLKRFQL